MRFLFLCLLIVFAGLEKGHAQKQDIDLDEIKQTVNRWSEAHNTKDKREFESLYAFKLLFYTKELTRTESINLKLKRLNEGGTFSQTIISDLVVEPYASGIIYCKFVKEVTTGRDVKQYPSYLLLKKYFKKYRIVGESDMLTDKRLKYRLDLGAKANRSNYEVTQPSKEKLFNNSTVDTILRNPQKTSFWFMAIVGSLILAIYSIRRNIKRRRIEELEGPSLQKERTHRQAPTRSTTTYSWSRLNQSDSKRTKKRLEISTDEQAVVKQKGNDFEGFVVNKFDRNYFRLIRWQNDMHFNGISPVANTYPDLEYEFHHHDFKRKFAIECKYRSALFNNQFELELRKLDNYRRYRDEFQVDVYLVLGVKGLASQPKELFLIPLSAFDESNLLSYEELEDYAKSLDKNFFYDKHRDELT